VIDDNTISKALQEVRDRIARAEHDRADLDRVIMAGREEERLLLRLLALRQGDIAEEPSDGEQETNSGRRNLDEARLQNAGKSATPPFLQVVVRELATAGRPVHISDLMRRLRELHIEIPGAGSQANLITHLRRDPRIVRPSRGMYGLSAWGLENMPTTIRRRRRRRKVRSKAAKEGTES